jgi:hypothetical protein
VAKVRETSPFLVEDRPLGGEIEALSARVLAGDFALPA